jgi:hypothetical protein
MNKLELHIGSNTVAVVCPRSGASTFTLHEALAKILGGGLGARPEFCGVRAGTSFWVAGTARPITIKLNPATPARLAWYAAAGSPAGEDPEFLTLAVDWRTATKTVKWNDTVFKMVGAVVYGQETWPDGDADAIKAQLASAETDEWLSEQGGKVGKGADALASAAGAAADAAGKAVRSTFPTIALVVVALGLGWTLLNHKK